MEFIIFILGFLCGMSIGGYLGWELKKDANTTTISNVTVRLNAQDIIDIQESKDEVENLKKELGLGE